MLFFFLRARSMWLAELNPDLSRLVVLFWYLRKGRHNKKLNLQLESLLRVFGAVSSYKNHGEMYEKGLCPTIWGKEIILYCDQNIYRSVSIVYIVDFKKIISGRFLPIQLY